MITNFSYTKLTPQTSVIALRWLIDLMTERSFAAFYYVSFFPYVLIFDATFDSSFYNTFLDQNVYEVLALAYLLPHF